MITRTEEDPETVYQNQCLCSILSRHLFRCPFIPTKVQTVVLLPKTQIVTPYVPRTENFSVRIQDPRWSQSVGGWSQDYKGVYVKTGTYGRFNNNSIPLYSRGRGLRGRTTYSEKSKILKIDDRKLIILFHTIYKWILIWKRSTIK